MSTQQKQVHIRYFAVLREKCKKSEESLYTNAITAAELFLEIRKKYLIAIPESFFRVAINNEFKDWGAPISDQDQIAFIPPVAGG